MSNEDTQQADAREGLERDIRDAINMHSAENASNTPDYILATFLTDCLGAYNKATNARSCLAEKLAKALASKSLASQGPRYEGATLQKEVAGKWDELARGVDEPRVEFGGHPIPPGVKDAPPQPEEDIYDAAAVERKKEEPYQFIDDGTEARAAAEEASGHNFKHDHFGMSYPFHARIAQLEGEQKELGKYGDAMRTRADKEIEARREAERREQETRGKLIKARKECERLRQFAGKLEAKSAVAVERLEREEAGIDALGMNIVELQSETKARAARIEELEKDAERYKARIKEITGWCNELHAKNADLKDGIKTAFEEGRQEGFKEGMETSAGILTRRAEEAERDARELAAERDKLSGFLMETDAAMTDLERVAGYSRTSTFLRDRIADLAEWAKENRRWRRVINLESIDGVAVDPQTREEEDVCDFVFRTDEKGRLKLTKARGWFPINTDVAGAYEMRITELEAKLAKAEKIDRDAVRAYEERLAELENQLAEQRASATRNREAVLAETREAEATASHYREQLEKAEDAIIRFEHAADPGSYDSRPLWERIDNARAMYAKLEQRLKLETERLRHEEAARKEAEETTQRCLARAEEEERVHLANAKAWDDLVRETEAKLANVKAKAKKWKGRAKDRKTVIGDLEWEIGRRGDTIKELEGTLAELEREGERLKAKGEQLEAKLDLVAGG